MRKLHLAESKICICDHKTFDSLKCTYWILYSHTIRSFLASARYKTVRQTFFITDKLDSKPHRNYTPQELTHVEASSPSTCVLVSFLLCSSQHVTCCKHTEKVLGSSCLSESPLSSPQHPPPPSPLCGFSLLTPTGCFESLLATGLASAFTSHSPVQTGSSVTEWRVCQDQLSLRLTELSGLVSPWAREQT